MLKVHSPKPIWHLIHDVPRFSEKGAKSSTQEVQVKVSQSVLYKIQETGRRRAKVHMAQRQCGREQVEMEQVYTSGG